MHERYSVIPGIHYWHIVDNHKSKQLDCQAATPEAAQFLADQLNSEENGMVLVDRREWERLKELERGLLQLCNSMREGKSDG